MRMSHLLSQLNPRQREAVELTDGPLLVLAGAGSGKTRVITYRVAYLIAERGVAPGNILAVTFTNKAADQMKERITKLLEGRLRSPDSFPHISTFHSFCVRLLRRDIDRLGYSRDFTIYDEDDQLRLLKMCISELGLGEQVVSPRGVLARISFNKSRGVCPEDLYQQATDPLTERIAIVYDRYQHKLRQAQALDFDDLLLKAVELLHAAADVREWYNRRFQYILVDEYQDTNRVQYELIRQLTRAHQNLCVVGDEDQSIYRWRGADIENILSFEKDYPSARIIRLEQNYRSTQLILDAATAVVCRNLARKGKTLWTERGPGQRVGLYEAEDADEEGEFVAGEIARALVADPEQTLAVLYRTNAQSRVFEEALRANRIDHRVVGGFRFYERAEIKDVLAYARLASNQQDSAALLRIINTPPRGIGDSTLTALEEAARIRNLGLWEVLEAELAAKVLPARALKALEGFHKLMRALIDARARMTMREFFRTILERTGYAAMLRGEDPLVAESRMENLQELINAAAEAEERGETLAEFLDRAALVSETDDYDERARVTLMTLHSAKGLEFSTVFLVGLEEGLFPHKLCLNDEAALEEERRLCYVGMTRAKDRLVLSWARKRRGFATEGFEAARPSRFLGEIPPDFIEPLDEAAASTKPRTIWPNALNSPVSVEHFLRKRGIALPKQAPLAEPSAHISPELRWKQGTRVRHPKFGLGVILDCEGEGEDTKLTVSFPGRGRVKLIKRYASLEKV